MAEEKKKFDFVAPFKDIPAALKGIPKGWLKMVRDNIKTPQQLEEIVPQVWAYTYLGVLATAAFFLLSLIPGVGGIFMILGVLLLIPTIITACKFITISRAKKRFELLTCTECNTLLDIDTPEEVAQYVTYEIISDELKNVAMRGTLKEGYYDKIVVHGQRNVLTRVTIKCPHCGATKSFEFRIFPFKSEASEGKVPHHNAVLVEKLLQDCIKNLLEEYAEHPERIPYSTHSVHHPEYNASTMNSSVFDYNGVGITYHRTIQEMVEGFFIRGEVVGHFK